MKTWGKHLIALAVIAGSSPALALNQSKHYDITVASCTSAGLPQSFCARAGAEDYDVDAREWNDLSAHSQIPNGSDACTAADASVWRAFWLGGQIRAAAQTVAAQSSQAGNELLAQHVGRALHTVQDQCAHAGMPNPQHAWHSLSDTCRSTTESPDVQPAAYTCARAETDALFAGLYDVLSGARARISSLSNVSTASKDWPAHSDVCSFLASAGNWDGKDRRWDGRVVRPAMAAQLQAGLSGVPSSRYVHPCRTAADVLPRMSDATFYTGGGAQSCLSVHIYCLGKADENAAPEPPPWETEESLDAASVPATGCMFGGGAPPAVPSLAAILIALALRTIRRRSARRESV
jgi:hypothetical protein